MLDDPASKLGRPRTQQLVSLQVLRALAAVAVVFYHIGFDFGYKLEDGPEPFFGAFSWGWAGVDLFFVLSGFVIMQAHMADLGRPAQLVRYVKRRVARIYPIYWVVLIFGILVDWRDPLERPGLVEFVRGFFLLPQADAFSSSRLLGISWTLTFEMLFYVLFALAIVGGRWVGLAIIGVFGSISLVRNVGLFTVPEDEVILSLLTHEVILEFGFGIAVAWWCARREVPRPKLLLLFGVVTAVVSGVLVAAELVDEGDRVVAFGIPALAIVAGAVGIERRTPLRVPRWLVHLGDASYVTYLTHGAAIGVVISVSSKFPVLREPSVLGRNLLGVLCAIVAVAGGVVAHVVVEKPILKWTRRKLGA